jgi:putative aldouronate transport system permease protein
VAIKRGEMGIDIIIYLIAMIVFVVTLYPILFVFFVSISTPKAVFFNEILLLPDRINFDSYKQVLKKRELWMYYYNTVWIVVIGTLINLYMTLLAGYVLSRKDFKLRNHMMGLLVFTMFFSGGLIPFFIQVKRLGLINTRWALVLPFSLSAWNVIIARTYIQSTIPEELHEAAVIDGASKLQILLRIVAPLSKPILAVIALWCSVGFWNSYFYALIFLPDPTKQPIQIFLMKLLVYGQIEELKTIHETFNLAEQAGMAEQMKYTVIIITILPILAVYPFLQKYFIKGVMIGALKG